MIDDKNLGKEMARMHLGALADFGIISQCELWTPEQKGRALEIVRLLAITPPSDWRTKSEIYEALAEFRPMPSPDHAK